MFNWIAKKLNNFAFNKGRIFERNLIDSERIATEENLKAEIKILQNNNKNLEKKISEITLESSNKLIEYAKENSGEILELKNRWKDEIEKAEKSCRLYNEAIGQINASQLYIKNYLETEAQKHNTASARLEDDIKQIEEKVNKGIKKI